MSALESRLLQAPRDLELRYQLSAAYLVNDRYQPAMDQLLEIIRLDRSFRDDVGVKGMVSILNIIAADTEQVKQYRQKMIDAMS
jgi:putative thioredoxin